jgi:thiosulfate/3-mercaptopyruvate sulfurtransferase
LIEVTELQAQLGNPDLVVVDCRFNLMEPAAGRGAWKAGHIPSAVYAHLDDDLARAPSPDEGRHPLPSPEAFAATLGRLGIARDSVVVAYDDQGGAIAARLWWMLGWVSHRKRFLLNGGLNAWEKAELPLEAGETRPVPREYGAVSADETLTASTAEIAAWSGRAVAGAASPDTTTLLDARAPARYRGEVEPIDPVAGHIPGAGNLPFSDLLDTDGRFRSSTALARIFAEALRAGGSADSVVAMCGSGVTACHLLAGLAITGHNGRLYAGSWSEWIRDPSRNIASDR